MFPAHVPYNGGAFQPVDLCSAGPLTDGLCPLQMLFSFAINDSYACCAQRIVVDQMAKCRVFVCVGLRLFVAGSFNEPLSHRFPPIQRLRWG